MLLFGTHQSYHFLNIALKCWCITYVNNNFLKLKPTLHVHKNYRRNVENVKTYPWCLFNVPCSYFFKISPFVWKQNSHVISSTQKIFLSKCRSEKVIERFDRILWTDNLLVPRTSSTSRTSKPRSSFITRLFSFDLRF